MSTPEADACDEPDPRNDAPGERTEQRRVWYAASDQISRMGPYRTDADAWAALARSDGSPNKPGDRVWPEMKVDVGSETCFDGTKQEDILAYIEWLKSRVSQLRREKVASGRRLRSVNGQYGLWWAVLVALLTLGTIAVEHWSTAADPFSLALFVWAAVGAVIPWPRKEASGDHQRRDAHGGSPGSTAKDDAAAEFERVFKLRGPAVEEGLRVLAERPPEDILLAGMASYEKRGNQDRLTLLVRALRVGFELVPGSTDP